MDNFTPEERQVRLKKADSIRRMLAEQTSSGPRNSGMLCLSYFGYSNKLLVTNFQCIDAHLKPDAELSHEDAFTILE